MGMSGDTALIQAKRYVKKTLQGQGALKGQDGFSPTVKENPSNTDNDYRLDITDKNGTFTTPNLKGADGSGSDYKQLKNKPSINGVELDGNKTLDDLGIQQKGEYLTEETDPTVPQWAKENTKPSYTASEVGADSVGSANMALSDAKEYTDNKIADLVGGAPETMDTLKELADALKTEQSTVEVLQEAIGTKLNKDGDSKDNIVTFVQSETRENIDSGDKHSVLFGKIRKWLFDLKEVAFSGSYTDLSNKPSATDIGALPKDGNATSATKATNDGDGNNIAETYATKVQVDEINSNLDELSYGEVAGGKNLLYTNDFVGNSLALTNNVGGVAPTGEYVTFTISTTTNDDIGSGKVALCIIRKDGTNSNAIYPNQSLKLTDADKTNFAYYRINVVSEIVNKVVKTCQIEDGSQATPYEPYIPSVKMLASENAQQNTEAMDLKMLGWTVPKECPIQNYVDSDGVFHQRVCRVDLGSLEWVYQSDYTRFYSELSNIKTVSSETDVANAYCEKYKIVSISGGTENKIIFVNNTSARIYLKDTSYTDATTLKTTMKGVYLYYELATEKTINVDGNEAVTKVNDSLIADNISGKASYNIYNNRVTNVIDDGTLFAGGINIDLNFELNTRIPNNDYMMLFTNFTEPIRVDELELNTSINGVSAVLKKNSDTQYGYVITVYNTSGSELSVGSQLRVYGAYGTQKGAINSLKNDLEALKDAIIAMGGTV